MDGRREAADASGAASEPGARRAPGEHLVTRLVILASLAASVAVLLSAGAAAPAAAVPTVDSSLAATLAEAAPTDMVDVLVVLKSQANLGLINASTRPARLRAVIRALQTHANATQK